MLNGIESTKPESSKKFISPSERLSLGYKALEQLREALDTYGLKIIDGQSHDNRRQCDEYDAGNVRLFEPDDSDPMYLVLKED